MHRDRFGDPSCEVKLEHVTQIKEPLGMACVSDTSADEQWPKGSARKNSGRTIVWKCADARIVVHFAYLIHPDGVNASAYKGREFKEAVLVSHTEEKVLISAQLIRAISKPPVDSADQKLRNARLLIAHGCASARQKEDRSWVGNALEVISFHEEIWKCAG